MTKGSLMKLFSHLFFASAFVAAAMNIGATERQSSDYSFISGSDLYDALNQESSVLQGYILGVTDALKQTSACFIVPLAPNADELIYATYIEYWQGRQDIPQNSLSAIVEAMNDRFPCY